MNMHKVLTIAVLLGIASIPAWAAPIPVNDPWTWPVPPTDEANLYELYNALYGTSYTSSAQLAPLQEDWETWALSPGQSMTVEAVVRYAWLTHNFGWYDVATGTEYTLFPDINNLLFLSGYTATIAPTGVFGFFNRGVEPLPNGAILPYYSEPVWNWLWEDHLVVLRTPKPDTYLLAWEDYPYDHPQSHMDFNDLLVEIRIDTDGEFFTYTQGGWGARPQGGNPGRILATNFGTVYPAGVEVGIPGTAGYSMKFGSAPAVDRYLPAGGTPRKLDRDYVNPTRTAAGVFGGQVLALQLNVDFCNAGVTRGSGGDLGVLKLRNTGTSLDGRTIREILAIANSVLGGGPLPAGYTVATLNNLVTNLNEAFPNGVWSGWAKQHLTK